jgi:hypothetical protein
MKNLFFGIVIAAILIAAVPAIRNAGRSSGDPAPAPLPAPSTDDRLRNYHSPLGGNGGLGTASLAASEAGKIQVYTVANLPAVRDGQVVRLRLSRPRYEATPNDAKSYAVAFVDQDLGGGISVMFPSEGATKLDLIHTRSQPGLTFYVALEPGGLRAVGQMWRADSRTYTW